MLNQTVLTSEAFACSRMPSLSPFPFIHMEAARQYSSSCLGLLVGMPSQPYAHLLSFHPPLLRDAAPREISKASMGSGPLERWCIVLRCCAHMCVLCSCTDLLMGCIFVLVFFPVRFHSHVKVFSVWVCVPSVRTNTQDCRYLPSLSNVLKVYHAFF